MSKLTIIPGSATDFLGTANSEERRDTFQASIEDAMDTVIKIKRELTAQFSISVENISVKEFGKTLMSQSHALVDEGIQAASFLISQGVQTVHADKEERTKTAQMVASIG